MERMPILVVDTDDRSFETLAAVLQEDFYAPVRAQDSTTAFRILSEGACRLLIIAGDVPQMTGLELCRAVRQRDFGGYVYIVLLTGASAEARLISETLAADEFLARPFHPGDLSLRLQAGRRVVSLETQDQAIFALSRLAESRDTETGHHLERVQCYSRALAMHLAATTRYAEDIDEEFVRLIFLTSPLHDIGKVCIPDEVLLKPGRLNSDEFEIMKTHTVLGAAKLNASLEGFPDATFLTFARDIAETHHERWDGTGYPHRLSGTDIPLCGRIVTLADVYDALRSRRVYKRAFTHSETRAIIAEGAGAHFDPELVDAFLAVEDVFLEIRECFASDEPSDPPLTPNMPAENPAARSAVYAVTSC